MWTKGRLLVATPALGDPNFDRTVVLMLEHADEGAVGVVLNRVTELGLDDPLPEWAPLASEPRQVFLGGPVAKGSIIGLARRTGATVPEGFDPVVGDVGVIDLAGLPSGEGLGDLRVFTGYAGWGAGQLEAEITADAWWVVDASPADVVTATPHELWTTVLLRQPLPLRRFAHFPLDLADN